VPRVLPLRPDTFEPHLAGMGEDGRAVAFDMLIEPDAGPGLSHDRCERGLADLKRVTPQVVAVQLDQVEGVEEHAIVSAVVSNEMNEATPVSLQATASPSMMSGAGAQAV